jgi:hypothetical protein
MPIVSLARASFTSRKSQSRSEPSDSMLLTLASLPALP